MRQNQIALPFLGMIFFILACRVDQELTDEANSDLLNWIDHTNSRIDTTTYYVSNTGDDQANGKSENSAFKTLTRAMQTVHPGGTIRILPGTYSESIGLLNCGSESAVMTVTGHNGVPILDGGDREAISFFCEHCINLVFQSLTIQNYTDIGIGASQCNGITLTNLVVRKNGHKVQLEDWELEGYGIHVEESENVVIENNNVSRNGPNPQVFPDRLMGTGINTYGNRNIVIRNNRSYENIGGGILVEDSEHVIVEDNEIYGNDLDATADDWWDGGIWLDGGHDVTIRNNLCRDNLGPGIEISDEDLQKPTGYVLENNISMKNYYGIFVWNFGSNDWPDTSILKQSNNQFVDNTRQDIWIVDWISSSGE